MTRVEHLDHAFGIGERRPRLSWRLPPEAARQLAYQIRTTNGHSLDTRARDARTTDDHFVDGQTADGPDPAGRDTAGMNSDGPDTAGRDTASPGSDVVDTGWVADAGHILVDWPFAPLKSAEHVSWQVRVRTELGDSDWSGPCSLETGLLEPGDWTASWIRPAETDIPPAGQRPAHDLRGIVTCPETVTRARLYATAHGLYEVFLNGQRVGDQELTPGFTQYTVRLQVQTYDVTALLRPGDNEIVVRLSDGWFRGQVGLLRSADQWGGRTAFLAQLHADGTIIGGTDSTWTTLPSPIRTADLIEGQTSDLGPLPTFEAPTSSPQPTSDRATRTPRPSAEQPTRTPQPAAEAPTHAAQPAAGVSTHAPQPPTGVPTRAPQPSAGMPVEVATEIGFGGLVGVVAPPVRRVQELSPVAVTFPAAGRQVVDLGQNINGWVRLTGLAGVTGQITLTHGESLGPDGDVDTGHLAPDMPFLPQPLSAGQVDRVTPAGADTFEPRHTTHGFRYVRVEGGPAQVTGIVVHTDLRRTGWFTCSDERVNRLHEAALWSFRGNACDIPTDCPTRERAGWTGDWQVFSPTAAFLYDVAGFSTKWLRDLAADQWDTGVVANMSPCPPAEGRHGPLGGWNGSAGWGDAAVIVPWSLYQAYGDERILAEQWPSMVAWLDHVERAAAGGHHPARKPDPHLWDTGFHWGEWLIPGEQIGDMREYQARDKADVATAYFFRSAALMARIAGVLGRTGEAAGYTALAAAVRAAWQAEFIGADGTIRPDTQHNLVRALAFGLLPEHLTQAAADRLAELIRAAGTHLATGFLSTADLLPVLADHGHADVAYELLLQDSEPSWMVMLDRGATTVWEWWDGVDAAGRPRDSLNHYSKGAVAGFLHRYTAGIRVGAPGYRDFRIEPVPGGGITSASAGHDSPYGRICSSWRLADGRLDLEVEVPPGTSAEVVLPSSVQVVGPGTHRFEHAY
ncbi:family 78 glycoside hydrolase catalytic domain [Actinoplanes derwentensis]|uniref:alpha-L-rhamnosidase n=1 Tax=Actinoplanes derwentensis TaxID=113562 RepID=A0A1H2D7Y1_9ACTN|nr:family 78 glycoside hydrolase catalytic domain [Actinoplanes derwentensis]GID89390.1 hypothetical protein Ade03nite_83140 [Actinoplanes derwentensis]SDT78572.1 Alpha-L-rhamnosidase N-terminal domain-containing protein [Actinoplanes derwentensis]